MFLVQTQPNPVITDPKKRKKLTKFLPSDELLHYSFKKRMMLESPGGPAARTQHFTARAQAPGPGLGAQVMSHDYLV